MPPTIAHVQGFFVVDSFKRTHTVNYTWVALRMTMIVRPCVIFTIANLLLRDMGRDEESSDLELVDRIGSFEPMHDGEILPR